MAAGIQIFCRYHWICTLAIQHGSGQMRRCDSPEHRPSQRNSGSDLHRTAQSKDTLLNSGLKQALIRCDYRKLSPDGAYVVRCLLLPAQPTKEQPDRRGIWSHLRALLTPSRLSLQVRMLGWYL
jgi:hypothetical protein